MEPHEFEHGGARFEVCFERVAEGWIGRIRREGDETAHIMAFPDGPGYDPDDVRGSLIAGCEAAVAAMDQAPPTRH
ncbi:hypothetical protein [Methylobacterium sp. 77]|uniref:hypothetical protein n=1 Tax=Methylobacterium sp. 77 TaxID=1101192 RepID=UPI00037840FB|nr:hypothetical protein [Methylobacterium sp. 77]